MADIRVGYVGVQSAKLAEWERFSEVLGFGVSDDSDGTALLLRMDEQHHRIAIHEGATERLAYVGWDLGGDDALDRALARLGDAGLIVEEAKDELCQQRRVARLALVEDPSGLRHELFCGPLVRPGPFRTGRPMAGRFVTGDQGLGHVVLMVPDMAAADDFYQARLGLRASDTAAAGPMRMRFLHGNARHHSVAYIEMPGMRGIQHVMIEVDQLDDVGIALDLCQERGYPISITLGRHHNDRMVSFYVQTPSGFDIEYGWGAIHVDDATWGVVTYDTPSLWGHKFDPQKMSAVLEPVG